MGKDKPKGKLNKFKDIRNKAIKKTREKLKEELVRRDNLIVQTVKAIDLLDKEINLMTEHVKEWYALYFPELARLVDDIEEYVKLVANIGFKENYVRSTIKRVIGNKGYTSKIVQIAETSMGAKLKKSDIKEIINFANKTLELHSERNRLNDYLKDLMEQEAPNISAVVGPTIGARLISTAGSLERFSRMPSSTVQVIGAEKALFSHLKRGTASPKYGIIFQYPKLRGAPRPIRGKIARKLASKISIAAKLDFFKGEFKGKEMAKKLQSDLDRLLSGKTK